MSKSEGHNTKPAAMTKSQLAALYGVCRRTLNNWLKPHLDEIGPPPAGSYLYTPAQVSLIFEKIGEP